MEERLNTAAYNGDIEKIVALLTDNPGLNVNWRDNVYDSTALHHASHEGHAEVAELLLAHPAINVNLQDAGAHSAGACLSNRKGLCGAIAGL